MGWEYGKSAPDYLRSPLEPTKSLNFATIGTAGRVQTSQELEISESVPFSGDGAPHLHAFDGSSKVLLV